MRILCFARLMPIVTVAMRVGARAPFGLGHHPQYVFELRFHFREQCLGILLRTFGCGTFMLKRRCSGSQSIDASVDA